MVLPSFPERFQLLRRLGEGGMGVVFEAFDRDRNARVALKTLKTFRHVGAPALLRFKREFRALQDVHHDNLVSLGELIAEGNEWFFTMELVEGADLLSYVRPRAPMPADGVRALHRTVDDQPSTAGDDPPLRFERLAPSAPPDVGVLDEGRLRAALPQLVSGLKALHAAGKVHRDIKPSNIRVTLQGRVVLLDFGLIADAEEDESLDGDLAGTPAYMAPEQIGATSVGPQADWYAVGVVLYEALTGRLPFEGTSLEILMQKQSTRPRPPRAVAPGVPKDLDELCMRLLATDPEDRPDAGEIARYLHVRV